MQPFIHSYTLFFIVFLSMFLLAIVMDWLGRKYNLGWLRTDMVNGSEQKEYSELKDDVRRLRSRLDRVEDKINTRSC